MDGGRTSGSGGGIPALTRDLDAAVRWVCAALDMAVVEMVQAEGGDRMYRIRTVNDEPVFLVIRSEAGWADPRARTGLEISSKVGRFGDRAREDELIGLLGERLGVLLERDG